jgi:hypothetical protein
MTEITYKGFHGLYDFDPDTEQYSGTVQYVLEEILFHGKNLHELRKNFEKCINDYLEPILNPDPEKIIHIQAREPKPGSFNRETRNPLSRFFARVVLEMTPLEARKQLYNLISTNASEAIRQLFELQNFILFTLFENMDIVFCICSVLGVPTDSLIEEFERTGTLNLNCLQNINRDIENLILSRTQDEKEYSRRIKIIAFIVLYNSIENIQNIIKRTGITHLTIEVLLCTVTLLQAALHGSVKDGQAIQKGRTHGGEKEKFSQAAVEAIRNVLKTPDETIPMHIICTRLTNNYTKKEPFDWNGYKVFATIDAKGFLLIVTSPEKMQKQLRKSSLYPYRRKLKSKP